MFLRLSLGLGLFAGSLGLGWWLRRLGVLTERRSSHLVRRIILFLSPLVLCLAFWRMDLRSTQPWLLPFLGFLISASTLAPALLYARCRSFTPPQTGSFLTCAFFSNLGYLGAFTAFALFGEAAYGLCMLYLVFFTPCFYTLGFWAAERYGQAGAQDLSGAASNDQLRLYPFLGMASGAILSLLDVPRPMLFEWLNHALIPLSTGLYLMAIGSQITFASPRPWLAPCLAMSVIKFLYTPLIAWLLVSALKIHGLPRVVILLQASTPVAVSPLVLPLLFGLDRRLSNALWLFTTLFSIPWFLLLIPLLPHL